jgi:hypothetical protein
LTTWVKRWLVPLAVVVVSAAICSRIALSVGGTEVLGFPWWFLLVEAGLVIFACQWTFVRYGEPRPSAFIPNDERDWWHAETWEEAAKALRDHYPMGCAIDTCSAGTEPKSHFCRQHADFMDWVARLDTAAHDYYREFDHLIGADYPERRALREALESRG